MNLVTAMPDEAEVILQNDNDSSCDDQQSHSDEDTTTTRSGSRSTPTVKEQKKVMAEAETRQVKIWRCILVISIIGTGALVSTLSYTLLHNRHVEEGNTAVSSLFSTRTLCNESVTDQLTKSCVPNQVSFVF
jgi:hypothetical protein